ncbi:MAG TPA: VCBS repeat-containing protein [Thermoanaerobaculia bacterium]
MRRTHLVRLVALCCLLPAGAARAQIQPSPVCVPVEPVNPAPAKLTPWFYENGDGSLVWGRHQFWEDPANTVFVLARDLITLDNQAGSWPEALLFNAAQFDPAEGINNGQPRKLMADSIYRKGLQLYVNYSNRTVDPSLGGGAYFSPTFFLSIDGHYQNPQTTPPVPWAGLSYENVSATRGAFGCIEPLDADADGVVSCDDLYVTAGIGYGLSDLDPDPGQQQLAQEAQRDRLMKRDLNDPMKRWVDVSQDMACPGGAPRIPAAAAAGNSSGVVFADLTGDGSADLYIGRQGDNYLGAPNVLLVNDGTGCFTDQTAARIPGEPAAATNEIAGADLDQDGDLDLTVANRCRRGAGCGAESEDYVLINNGQGFFTRVVLNPGQATDTRSVAVGDLNHDNWPEIVMGNAGSDGFSNVLSIPPAEDHPMQIFVNNIVLGGTLNTFLDVMALVLGGNEPAFTRPLTQQVLLVDLFSPTAYAPDGWLDLVIVNHRDILKDQSAFTKSSNAYFLVNTANWAGGGPFFAWFAGFEHDWVKAVALARFTGSNWLDALAVGGNRFSGVRAELFKNRGTAAPLGQGPWDFSGGFIDTKSYESFPGNERGYGFDFADFDADGALDALQTSRGYDYLVQGILSPAGSAIHRDLAPGGFGNGLTSNWRGRLRPKGMEDGVFEDFDADGDLDALLASQRQPSALWPIASHGNATPDTLVLVNNGFGSFGFDTVGSPFRRSTTCAST